MPEQGEKPNRIKTGRFPPLAGALSLLLIVYIWINVGPWIVLLVRKAPIRDPILKAYLVANAPFFAMAFGIFLSLRFLMRTTTKHIITDNKTINWWLMIQSGGAYLTVALLFTFAKFLRNPHQFQLYSGDRQLFLQTALFVLIITPLQTTSEEFLLRSIPARLFREGRLVRTKRSILLVSLLTALLFLLPHLFNLEMVHASQKMAVVGYYLLFGFGGTYISLQTRGFEPSIAIHAVNNLYVAIICNYTNSSLPSRPLILSTAPVGTFWDVLQLVLGLSAVGWVLLRTKSFKSK